MKENDTSLVTIGLPMYNAERFIENTILSLKNQTYKNWECIIIDDNSLDGSVKIVESIIKFDSRFRFILDTENKGLPYRLNQIASMCKTKYLARMDADDIMHPDRLRNQVEYLQDHQNIDVVGSTAYAIDVENIVCGYKYTLTQFDIQDAIQESLFIHPSIMGRADWFRTNPYDPKSDRFEDYELWLRTVENSRFKNIDEPLLFYREVGLSYAAKYSATADGIVETLEKFIETASPKLIDVVKRKIRDVKYKKTIFNLVSKLGLERKLIARRFTVMSPEATLEAQRILLKAIEKNY